MSTPRWSLPLYALLLTFFGSGCESKTGAMSPAQSGSAVVARYGKHAITIADVDRELGQQLYEFRRQALKSLLMTAMIDDAAKTKGVEPKAFYQAQIDRAFQTPTAEAIAAAYDKGRAEGKIGPEVDYGAFTERFVAMRKRRAAFASEAELFEELARSGGLKIDHSLMGHQPAVVRSRGPARGRDDAKIEIVEFADYTSRFAAMGEESLRQIMAEFGDSVRVKFRVAPEPGQEGAQRAGQAALCAAEQNRFLDYRRAVLSHQSEVSADQLKQQAQRLGLDLPSFATCLDKAQTSPLLAEHIADYQRNQLQGQPSWIINGFRFGGAIPIDDFRRIIRGVLDQVYL